MKSDENVVSVGCFPKKRRIMLPFPLMGSKRTILGDFPCPALAPRSCNCATLHRPCVATYDSHSSLNNPAAPKRPLSSASASTYPPPRSLLHHRPTCTAAARPPAAVHTPRHRAQQHHPPYYTPAVRLRLRLRLQLQLRLPSAAARPAGT